MIPEADVGYFGGAPDNFTYPRYTFDVSFLRVYGEGGEPLSPEAYFPFAEEGSAAGEPVFVVGNPGSTSRLETVSQLAFRRDV
ncbi:MAG: S46 family peptidase, partial [Bacteroidetes bacterium QS_1_65_9]